MGFRGEEEVERGRLEKEWGERESSSLVFQVDQSKSQVSDRPEPPKPRTDARTRDGDRTENERRHDRGTAQDNLREDERRVTQVEMGRRSD